MTLLRVEPVLLGAGVGASDALVEDLGGRPGVVIFEGDWGALADLSADDRAGRHLEERLRGFPALTIAVGAPQRRPLSTLGSAFDLVTDDAARARAWAEGFARSPLADMAVVLLARRRDDDTFDGLVAESTTYSMLQAGEEFRGWLADRCETDGEEPGLDDSPRVRVDRCEDVGVMEITLTRPAKHNALDTRMREELYAALGEALLRDEPVVVRGEGPSFCSGGDLDEFGTFPGVAEAHLIRLSRSLALRFSQLGPRMVVGLQGSCLGAGIELAAFAARVIAMPDVRIGLPEAGLGLIPGAGGTVSIRRRAGRARLLELVLTGRTLDARAASDWGLVDEVVAGTDRAELSAQLWREAGELR